MLGREVGNHSPKLIGPSLFPGLSHSQPQPLLFGPWDCNALGAVPQVSSSKGVSYPRTPGRHLGQGKGFYLWGNFWGPLLGLSLGRQGVAEGWNPFCDLAVANWGQSAPFPAIEGFHFIQCVFYQCFQPCCLIWAVHLCFIIGSSKKFLKEAG